MQAREPSSPSPNLLIHPRVTDYHGISCAQKDLDFAIPFFEEDIPLYVDPFLLWKSPSLQDQSLHTSIVNCFNHLGLLVKKGKKDDAMKIIIEASECDEVGLGVSRKKKGQRIGAKTAKQILDLFELVDQYRDHGFAHFEEIQLFVDGISKDRVSDICCSFIKSFLIDYTIQECTELGIPLEDSVVSSVYDYRENRFVPNVKVKLPVNPNGGSPLLFVPKRWLRFAPWINFDEYFVDYCPRDKVFNPGEAEDRVKVLNFNREHYGLVKGYIEAKVRTRDDCKNDPLFKQIPIHSAKRKLAEIKKLPTGKDDGADSKYEAALGQLLPSILYPDLDFAAEQSRTISNRLIRDLLFYNNRSIDFLDEIHADYGSRQVVFELKNVKAIDREHINQLNRYLDSGLGRFGVLVTRRPFTSAMFSNTIDLWSGQRRCVIALTDEDLDLMVNVFESRQRTPLDVLKKKYVEFRRACPS